MFFNNLFNDFSPFSNNSYRYSRPETRYPSDNRSIIVRKLLNDEYNYMCFDCRRQINELKYFDLKNGTFLCYNCAIQHSTIPKEISEVLTGDIRKLDERYLLPLYYGGNRNLIEFIRRYYPLLEKMEIKNIYSTKAMDYYRKLIRSKVYNEPEPYLPRKLEGYNSIYKKTVSPTNEHNYNNINKKNRLNEEEEEEKNNDLFRSTIFGDNFFNRKNNEDEFFKKEPAVINNKNNDDDVEMKDVNNNENENNKSKDSIYEDAEGINDKDKKFKKEADKYEKKKENKKKGKEKNIKSNKFEKKKESTLNINQIGEISMYPDALEIDGMDC